MPTHSPRGTYLHIADLLRTEIERNPDLVQLPSEAALTKRYTVARSTVRGALLTLAAEGIIYSRPGVGWGVTGRTSPVSTLSQITAIAQALRPGDPFPSEWDLVETTGSSRGVVRRALAQLETEGVLEVRHGKGRRVAAIPAQQQTTEQDSHG